MAKYPQQSTIVTFQVNYDYEKERLRRLGQTIAPAEQWYYQQAQKLKKLVYEQNMAGLMEAHTADFRRDSSGNFLLDGYGSRVPEPIHYHGILSSYGGFRARPTAWAKLLEDYGIHISKVNATRQQLSNIQTVSPKGDALERAMAYLPHATANARKAGKTLYDFKSVLLFNTEKLFEVKTADEAQKCYVKVCDSFMKEEIKYTDEDFLAFFKKQRVAIDEGTTIDSLVASYKAYFKGDYPAYERAYLKDLQKARDLYLQKLASQVAYFDRDFTFIHIFGPGGAGKSSLAMALAGLLAGDDMRIHQASTSGKKKTPDFVSTYHGELVSVVNELKSTAFSADEFESFADPHIYPTLSSRNKDKPYFARCVISAKSTDPAEWLYMLFYYDSLYGDKGKSYLYDEDKKFPTNYSAFFDDLTKNETDIGFMSSYKIPEFLDEWWQLIRRMSYLIKLVPMPEMMAKHGAVVMVYKLKDERPTDYEVYGGSFDRKNDDRMKVANRAFKNDFNFWARFVDISSGQSLSCLDVTDPKQIAKLARDIYSLLVQTGLHPATKLPKLLSTEELRAKTGLARPLVPLDSKIKLKEASETVWPISGTPLPKEDEK